MNRLEQSLVLIQEIWVQPNSHINVRLGFHPVLVHTILRGGEKEKKCSTRKIIANAKH